MIANSKKIILLFLILPVLGSCSGFLKENHVTFFDEEAVFKTEQTLEAQIYGCYSALHSTGLWKGSMEEFLHTASGLMIWRGAKASNEWLDGLYLAKFSTNNQGNQMVWDDLWVAVNRCNRLLDGLDGSPVDDAFKLEIEAEARFIRAVCYFTLVRLWGDVPLVLSSPREMQGINNPRQPFYKVYAQVLSDLGFAELNMRGKGRQEMLNPAKNRPFKWAATAYKSLVYLTIGSLLGSPDDNFWDSSKDGQLIAEGKLPRTPDFTGCDGIKTAQDAYKLAFETAEKVIESKVYSLCSDYRILFRWTEVGDWTLDENIFVLPSSDRGGSNFNSVRMLPQYPEGSSNYSTINNNYGRVRPSRFGVDNFIKYSGGRRGTGLFNSSVYAETSDPRYKATFFTQFKQLGQGMTVTTYPADTRLETYNSTNCLPYVKKYLDPTYDVTSGTAHMYMMRLAEVYLVSAEAAANLSGGSHNEYWQKSILRVNELRARARASVDSGSASCPPDWTEESFSSSEDLVNAIIWERWIELCGENHEWFDTHRKGAGWLSEQIAAPMNRFYLDNKFQNVYCTYMFPKESFTRGWIYCEDKQSLRKSLLMAYPQSELRLNTAENCQNDYFWQ